MTARHGYKEGGHGGCGAGGNGECPPTHNHQKMWKGWGYNSSGAQIGAGISVGKNIVAINRSLSSKTLLQMTLFDIAGPPAAL